MDGTMLSHEKTLDIQQIFSSDMLLIINFLNNLLFHVKVTKHCIYKRLLYYLKLSTFLYFYMSIKCLLRKVTNKQLLSTTSK